MRLKSEGGKEDGDTAFDWKIQCFLKLKSVRADAKSLLLYTGFAVSSVKMQRVNLY